MNPPHPPTVRFAEEARKGRRRLYPPTIIYTALSIAALGWGLSENPGAALVACALGVVWWTWLEYVLHRFLLHGEFPDGPGIRHFLHRVFDHLHVEHHRRPWDGNHINGTIKDSWWIVGGLFAISLFFPPWSMTSFLAGALQAGIFEEWVHHSVHYYHFDNRYFRYIKRHHMYHHSPKGDDLGYGLSNGFWDVIFGTRFPAAVRARLHAPRTRRRPLAP